jgi:hypothetical protein
MLQKPGPGPRTLAVPTVLDVADRSRTAALAFVRGTGLGWGAEELGAWLAGPYRAATTRSTELVRSGTVAPFAIAAEEGTLERALFSTRERLLEVLTSRNGWVEFGFSPRAVASRLVIPVRDSAGSVGYAPVDHPKIVLFDRIASLFFADYLTRPRDYEDFFLCEDCGELSFSWERTHHRYCEVPPNRSAVVEIVDGTEDKNGVAR